VLEYAEQCTGGAAAGLPLMRGHIGDVIWLIGPVGMLFLTILRMMVLKDGEA
jgi:hypothetical protein